MTIQVYCDPCTVNSRKVLAGLDQMKVDYKQNYIDYFAGEHKNEAFKQINPHATVPAATDGDLSLTESNAILQYAADLSGADSMYPKDLKHRADINRWLLWEASVWFECCYVYLIEYVVKPLLNAVPDESVIETENDRFHKCAGILDARLSRYTWLTGDNVTIADIAVAAPMHLHAAQRLPLDKYPHLRRWMTENIEQLDSWQKTQGAHTVRTTVNYTRVVPQLTELYLYETDKAKGIHVPGDAPVEVTVSGGWPHAKDFTLAKNGFSLHEFRNET